ncbi:MAG: class I SAM-dependent methyltransferase [Candidatus Competibacter sp.]|nr:class I SAM-dependent methyltransferase [Candidatus Competibacter sp.]MDG4583176.1 class I SAM-dependent methyltransferase [Candidatus Competibacter sp.]
MHSPFTDHFAPVTTHYARFRPTYPEALFAWLATIAPARELAWDCAAGSGQATLDLARHFARVIATDASRAQIDAAPPHPNIEYRVAPAEASSLSEATADVITVAQALHWFDLDRFYGEARRVLKPDGILAAWTYGVQTVDGACVDACVQTFYRETMGRYWPPERRHVESGYRTLPFPFHEIPAPEFRMTANWILPELLGYLRSWSATGRYRAEHGTDPVDGLATELAPLWGDPSTRRQVIWPLSLRVGWNRG